MIMTKKEPGEKEGKSSLPSLPLSSLTKHKRQSLARFLAHMENLLWTVLADAMVSRSLLHPLFHEERKGTSQERCEGLGFEEGLAAVQPITPCDDAPGREGVVVAMSISFLWVNRTVIMGMVMLILISCKTCICTTVMASVITVTTLTIN